MMDKREGANALEPHLVDLLGQVQMGLGVAVRKGAVRVAGGQQTGLGVVGHKGVISVAMMRNRG
jgi:hypothetical protein